MLYLAYGSNLNRQQMAKRCPGATLKECVLLEGWKLVFRGVADIERSEGDAVPVGIWDISKAHKATLDRYEGCIAADPTSIHGLYRETWLELRGEAVLVYLMNQTDISPPFGLYEDGIRDAYHDLGLPVSYLDAAVKHSQDERSGEGYVSKRHQAQPNFHWPFG